METDVPVFFYWFVTVALGLCLGSFATALAYRLPRGESMVTKKRSACPSCGKALGFADLIPLFSWIFLLGRCRHCKAKIGWQYPLIEVLTVFLCIAFYLKFGFSLQTLALFALAPVMTSMADIDFRFKIIPDALNIAVFAVGVAVLLAGGFSGGGPDFVMEKGAFALGGVLFYGLGALALRQGAMRILKREPMGLGDVKFFAAAGFWLGPSPETLSGFMIVSGSIGVLLALLWNRLTGEREFPFGPALIVAFIALLFLYPVPIFLF